MSLSGIEASSNPRAPLAKLCGFVLAPTRSREFPRDAAPCLARVEVGDHREDAAVIVLRLR
jgi:hypothetical protein